MLYLERRHDLHCLYFSGVEEECSRAREHFVMLIGVNRHLMTSISFNEARLVRRLLHLKILK